MAKTKERDLGGRPRRAQGETKMVGVRLTDAERKAYEAAAERDELSLAEWIRAACQERLAKKAKRT